MFTDHLAKYPEFANQEQLVPLDDTIKPRTTSTPTQYQPGPGGPLEGQRTASGTACRRTWTPRLFYNKDMADAAGVDRRSSWTPGMEPHRRRHLRGDHRQPDRRRKRRARRRARLRQDQRQDLRPRASTAVRWRRRADPVEHVHRQQRTGPYTDKNPWGTQYNYDEPEVPGDHRLVAVADRQGLHAPL